MLEKSLNVLGLSGSLRRASLNTALLRAAAELAPADTAVIIHPLNEIPLYDEDLEQRGLPPSVLDLRDAIQRSDAMLLATPEYNGSTSAALKNALDWATRPVGRSVLDGKPVAIFGAGGGLGTARAQAHLRHVAVSTNMHALNAPEVFVSNAWTKFDADLRLTDEPTRAIVARMMEGLADWTRRLRAADQLIRVAA